MKRHLTSGSRTPNQQTHLVPEKLPFVRRPDPPEEIIDYSLFLNRDDEESIFNYGDYLNEEDPGIPMWPEFLTDGPFTVHPVT